MAAGSREIHLFRNHDQGCRDKYFNKMLLSPAIKMWPSIALSGIVDVADILINVVEIL